MIMPVFFAFFEVKNLSVDGEWISQRDLAKIEIKADDANSAGRIIRQIVNGFSRKDLLGQIITKVESCGYRQI